MLFDQHQLDRHGDVFVLQMNDGENRFNPSSIAGINAALDQVEAHVAQPDQQCALVTTGTGKFFSNGIDLDWMVSGESENPMAMVADMQRMWARMMSLPVPTVAAVNGHAFAGGAMFSLTHDHVLMRADRGYWCVNEVLLQMRFTPGMHALLTQRLSALTAKQAMLTAHRFDGPAALGGGIVNEIHDEPALLPRAIELAQSLVHTANPVLGILKEDLHADVLAPLRAGAEPAPF